MYRYIRCVSYNSALQDLFNQSKSSGLDCQINKDHRCVDVFDSNGFLIGQAYPKEIDPTLTKRSRFKKVGEGEGNYIKVQEPYSRREFDTKNPLYKHVNFTQKALP